MTEFGLPPAAVEGIRRVLSGHPEVSRAVLYGSRAKGNYRNGSDIDLTLFGDELSLALLLKIMDELDELLLPWMIDISLYSTIENPALRDHINRVGVVFFDSASPQSA